jgi:hypothetical protein
MLGNWTWPPEQPTKQQESEGQEDDSSEDEDDNDEEESKPQRPRLARELRALGITPKSQSVQLMKLQERDIPPLHQTLEYQPHLKKHFLTKEQCLEAINI